MRLGWGLIPHPIFCRRDTVLTINSKDPIDRDYFESKMRETGFIYVDPLKFKNTCSKFTAEAGSKEYELEFKMQLYHETHSPFMTNNRDNIITILEMLGAPMGKLLDRNDSISLNMDSKVKPLLLALKNGTAKSTKDTDKLIDFLETFIDYKSTVSKANGAMKKLNKNFVPCDEYNKFGKKLAKIPFEIKPAVTGRYYYSNDNIQGYALNYVKSFCVPKGRVLVSIDFAQIDLRVAENFFLKNKTNAHIFDACEDKYEALVRAIDDQAGRQFDLESFKANRPAYKEMALACLYGSRSMSGRLGDPKIVKILEQFYDQCDQLNALKFIGKSLWMNEQDVMIEDYFGYIRDITFSEVMQEYGDSKGAKINNAASKIINTPVQTTSASIMPIVTTAIIEKFKSIGYSEDDVKIFMNRHDEIVFDIDEKVMKDIWVFKDYEKIYIDDWDELRIEVEIYDYYKELNEEYMKMYEENWKAKLGENLERETPKKPTTRKVENYNPLGKMFCIMHVSDKAYEYSFNKFCRSIGILSEIEDKTGLGYEQDFSVNTDALEFVHTHNPAFWDACELAKSYAGSSIIVDINRSLVSKTKSNASIEHMVKSLNSDVTYVYEFDGTIQNDSNVISRSKTLVEGINLFSTLYNFCAKEGSYYRINRDLLSSSFI